MDIFMQEIKTPIGPISLVTTKTHLIATDFGKTSNLKTLAKQRREELQHCSGSSPLLKKAEQALKDYFQGNPKPLSEIPLDPRGTSFQESIWKALLKIPYGKTSSYGEIAVKSGHPKAARAVGMANARNPIAIFIPCHRVIGADGSLTGFGGGLKVKEQLLELEKNAKTC
ncbi:MAG: methylated-DNA--[protein]-cysteine S-methyltransferase [Planctomycetota bacterium]